MSEVQQVRFDLVPIAEAMQHEVSLLREWFKRDYPESDLRVDCDFNGILFSLSIQVTVLMGEEVAKNRLLFRSKPLRLVEKDLRNEDFMYTFYKVFQEEMRKQIQGAFNRHYQQEKAREEATLQ